MMATIVKRKGPNGALAFLVQVRIKGFKPAAKTFPATAGAKLARAAAVAWVRRLERGVGSLARRSSLHER